MAAVVPAYNEETQISVVVKTMPDYVDRIVIVDDKSTDSTVEIVKKLKETDKRIKLICHEVNQGVGAAIASGYKWARDNDIDMAVVMAGDAQMDPVDMPNLLDPVVENRTDYSKGNRLIHSETLDQMPRIRLFGNAMLSLLTKIASGYWHIADSQTGYTVINKQALKEIDWDSMYKRYGQPNDLLVRLNVHNFRVMDVPIKSVYDVGEVSGIKVRKAVFTIGSLLVRLFFWRLKRKYIIYDFHPLVLFYLMGFALLLLSGIFAIRLAILWIMHGAAPSLTAIALMFSFSMGMQSIFFAMWFDMNDNRHLRGHDFPPPHDSQ